MKVVILERMSVGGDVSVDSLGDFGELTVYDNTLTDEIAERVKDADIVIANKSKLNETTLKDAKNVKLICEFATGFDNVNLEYCKSRGIKVCNVVDYCTDMVAQHTFALAMAVAEKLAYYDNYVKSGEYATGARFTYFKEQFTELAGKTWGIVGMGHIGRKVAEIAKAFGCNVIFTSVTGKSTVTEYEQVSKEELLKRADYLSLHCPLSDITLNYIGAEEFKQMKKTAIIVNVARGKVVDNIALYDALENGEIAAAGLDVLMEEPINDANPLTKIKDSRKLIITPHIAWASVEARTRCVSETYENIKSVLAGVDRNVVNK